jgi:hypothetical protein
MSPTKRCCKFAVGLLILATFTPVFGAPVSIPDDNLRAKVEEALDFAVPTYTPGDPIDTSDMEALTLLSANGAGIVDLTGLETAINLERLFIYSNNISDLSPISGLTSLTRIDADFNNISDLSPLAGLVNLDFLVLRSNPITSLTDLSALTAMNTLNVAECSVDSLVGLENMTQLVNLLAFDNAIQDLSPISNLTSLQQVNVNGNSISDIVALQNLTNLTTLRFGNNQVSDIQALSNLTNLTVLNVENNYLDLSAGSEDRAVIDGLPGTTTVTESPQKTMSDYAAWVTLWNIPFDQDEKTDTNGPLQFVNLITYSMGLDPFSAAENQIPTVVREPGTDTYSFYYYRDITALGINRQINVSPDLTTWTPTLPDQVNVLTDDGNGVQYVEAIFEIAGPKQFFQLEVLDY